MNIINKVVDLTDLDDKKYQFYADAAYKMRDRYRDTGRPFYKKFCGGMRVWEYSHLLVNTVDPFNCKDQVVLDAGCNSTVFVGILSHLYERVYGIDNIEEEIVKIKNIMSDLEIRNVEHCHGDISNMSCHYRDEMFDRVYSVCVIEHLAGSTQQEALKECVRVLKWGGILGFTFDFGKLKSEQGFFDEEDVENRLIKTLEEEGMFLLGNKDFKGMSQKERTSKKSFTFGCLFFEKMKDGKLKKREKVRNENNSVF